MKISSIIVMIYALLLLIGGMMGFIKAQSMASLLMGTACALIVFAAGLALLKGSLIGWWTALVASAFLTAFFGYRFYLSQKMMPGGMMALISLIVLLLLLFLGREKIPV